jgi:hypothetical protein
MDDPELLRRVSLCVKEVWLNVQRSIWLLKNSPDAPWVRWQIDRNANQLAKRFIAKRDKTND